MKNLFCFVLSIASLFNLSTVKGEGVQIYQGGLNKALIEAREEGKKVLVMVSTTWCAPCKAVVRDVLPLEKTGDYVNERYVFLKYDIDEADPDQIDETYGISVFPTYLFLDELGDEITRKAGGKYTAEDFIALLESALTDPSIELKSLYEADPSEYAGQYYSALCMNHDFVRADAVLDEIFSQLPTDLFFEKYGSHLDRLDLDSRIIHYLLENTVEGGAYYGNDLYRHIVSNAVRKKAWNIPMEKDNEIRASLFSEFRQLYTKYPHAGGSLADFIFSNQADVDNCNITGLGETVIRSYDEKDAGDIADIFMFIVYLAKNNGFDRFETELVRNAAELDRMSDGRKFSDMLSLAKNK